MKASGRIVVGMLAFALMAGNGTAQVGKGPEGLPAEVKARYQASEVDDGVWRIDEHGSVNMYLVVGKKKALMIDTGLGEAGLDAVVASITDLPVIAVNTHGHEDHSGGNRFFKTIYAHKADMSVVKRYAPGKKFAEIGDGYVFDLGGRKLSVILTPGHTAGSLCLVDDKKKILFSGDNNNTHVWLFLYESLSVEEYLASLERLIARSAEFETILPGHGGLFYPSFLDGVAECARAVVAGGIETQPYQHFSNARGYQEGGVLIAFDPKKVKKP